MWKKKVIQQESAVKSSLCSMRKGGEKGSCCKSDIYSINKGNPKKHVLHSELQYLAISVVFKCLPFSDFAMT